MKKFLLVDDHAVVRSGVKMLLQEVFKPTEIFEAGDGESALKLLKDHTYDLVILDVQLPNTDTIALMDIIHLQYPDLKVLMFSMSAEKIHAKRFLRAGAKGFVSKEAPLEEIIKAINLILNNRRYISDSLADFLADDSIKTKTDNPFSRLSAREFEIASLLLAGGTVSSISKLIDIKVSTVGTHKTRLFDKLGISNILELKELATSYNL